MAQPPTAPPTGPSPGPSSPTSPPFPAGSYPPPYPYYPPPPRKDNTILIVVVVIVVVIAIIAVLAAILFFFMTPLIQNPMGRPVLTFSNPSVVGNQATFTVAAVSAGWPPSSYRFNLLANTGIGTVKTLGNSGVPVSIAVGSNTYTVTFTDLQLDGKVTGGDRFEVSGLVASSSYVFMLLWNDGFPINSVTFST